MSRDRHGFTYITDRNTDRNGWIDFHIFMITLHIRYVSTGIVDLWVFFLIQRHHRATDAFNLSCEIHSAARVTSSGYSK